MCVYNVYWQSCTTSNAEVRVNFLFEEMYISYTYIRFQQTFFLKLRTKAPTMPYYTFYYSIETYSIINIYLYFFSYIESGENINSESAEKSVLYCFCTMIKSTAVAAKAENEKFFFFHLRLEFFNQRNFNFIHTIAYI